MKKSFCIVATLYFSFYCLIAFAEEKHYPFSGFTKINFSTPGNLHLSESDEYRIIVEGTEDQIEDIVIQKKGSVLEIEKRWSLFGIDSVSLDGIVLRISIPRLEAATASSSGSIHGQNRFTRANRLKLVTSSSGSLTLSAQAEEIQAVTSSTGSITLSGKAAKLTLEARSSGNIEFSGDISEKLKAETSSVGNIVCELTPHTVVPDSQLQIRSVGNISVTGKGTRVEANSSSAGDLLLKYFLCNDMKIDLTSSGSAYINVTGKLDMNSSSSGRIINQVSPRIY
jgi:putative autotransporter adhesin-like protein